MGMYQITVSGDAPQIFIGENLNGAKVVAIKDVSPKLVSASDLAEQYNMSVDIVRSRLAEVNRGTKGKALYSPSDAHLLLTSKPTKNRRPRKN